MISEDKYETEDAGECCGPECSCQAPSSGRRMKFVICGIVLLVAVGVVTARLSLVKEAGDEEQDQYSFTAAQTDEADHGTVPQAANAWGALNSLAELNSVAVDNEAVFVFLPTEDESEMARIEHVLSEATSAVTSRGIRIKTFLLSESSPDYPRLAKQMGTPAIIAMYKGRGSNVVSGDKISKDALLKAVVASSRPVSGGCCPGGAPSSGCK